jgi:hypothetical protein
MDIQSTKMELIEMLISTRKESVLMKIKAILEKEQGYLTEDDYKIIDARRESHLKGESKSYTWEEARAKIENR